MLLRHKMTSIVREGPSAGRVLGITATHDGRTVNIAANKGVLVATGGSTSNVTLRRTFDPRLTEEYQVAGEPWSRQSGDGELAAMAVGASLWGTANQTVEEGIAISKTRHIGCQWGYNSLIWQPDARIFDLARASGLTVADWHDVILVNQTGRRFWNEVDARYDFFAAAMAWNGDENKLNGGGPIWAVFDQDGVEREEWDPRPPNVDLDGLVLPGGHARRARRGHHEPVPVEGDPAGRARGDGRALQHVRRPRRGRGLRQAVAALQDSARPPFYAAWSTPILHDSLTGLRTNTKAQVIDTRGQVIPGLYCAGESQGGFAQHGLGRCLVFGRIAGRDAAVNGGVA